MKNHEIVRGIKACGHKPLVSSDGTILTPSSLPIPARPTHVGDSPPREGKWII